MLLGSESSASAWIVYALVLLAIIFVILMIKRKELPQRMSKLESLAFVLIVMGLFLAENRLLGYSLLGAGVILAVLDILDKSSKSKP